MAKLNLSLDTETGVMETTVDGNKVDNVGGVMAYADKYNDKVECHFEVQTFTKSDSGVKTRMCIYANKQEVKTTKLSDNVVQAIAKLID